MPPLAWPGPDAGVDEALAHPAVELFADRGAAAAPGFAVDAENVAAVIEICRRLDGLPLALELAAARLRALAPEQLAGGSTTASGCSPAAAAPRCRATGPCAPSSTGAGTC